MRFIRLFAYTTFAGLLAGCAGGRQTIDVPAPHAANPSAGKFVSIKSVLDKREFWYVPPTPDVSSLDPNQDRSEQSKARAFGRQFERGRPRNDVVLPSGKTVAGLVEAAIATGLKESGYTVVAKGDVHYDAAAPVTAEISSFWTWFQPGFFSVTANHKSEVRIRGNVGRLNGDADIKTKLTESKQLPTTSDWREIVERSLSSITEQTKAIVTP